MTLVKAMRYFILTLVVIFLLQICSAKDIILEHYMGCFKDNPNNIWYEYKFTHPRMSVDYCFTLCTRKGLTYAALREGQDCLCGSSHVIFANKVDDSECDITCNEDKRKCGGKNKSVIYYFNLTCTKIVSVQTSNYLGCFEHVTNLLSNFFWKSTDLTLEMCIETCKKKSSIYAGVQNGNRCYCGKVEEFLKNIKPETECNMKCGGNENEICGGQERIGVYEAGKCEAPNTMPEYVGCFQDNPKNIWYEHKFAHPRMSADNCFTSCTKKGSMYAALHEGLECLCGSSHVTFADKVIDSECDITCIEHNWICGGKNKSVVYYLKQNCTKVVAVQTSNYLGCFEDVPWRRLDDYLFYDFMTVEKCIKSCIGFIYAGVQYGIQCFCGNSEQLLENRKPETECNFKCRGNPSENCGGKWRLGLYEAGKCVNKEIPPAGAPIYLGCYQDYPYRTLIGYSYKDSCLTRQKCFTTCSSKGLVYAALNKDECYCSSHPELLQARTNDSDCNYNYVGEKNICGGTCTLSVFYLQKKCEEVAGINTMDVYLGCYQDDEINKKLKGYMFTSEDISNELCTRTCKEHSYLFAGMQKGIYCYCGNEHPLPDDRIGEDQCNYTCKNYPSKKKLCGGDMTNAIYAVGKCTKTGGDMTNAINAVENNTKTGVTKV